MFYKPKVKNRGEHFAMAAVKKNVMRPHNSVGEMIPRQLAIRMENRL